MFILCFIQSTLNPPSREFILCGVVGIIKGYCVLVVKTSFRSIALLLFKIFNSVSKTQRFKLASQLPKGYLNKVLFVPIPTARLKDRIAQLCEQYGIQFIETEESYTSKASFLDGDDLPTYGEKPDDWKPSGKRTKRGLYRTAINWYINADGNSAANIIRKVSRTLGLDLSRLSRGVLTRPQRISLWSVNGNVGRIGFSH